MHYYISLWGQPRSNYSQQCCRCMNFAAGFTSTIGCAIILPLLTALEANWVSGSMTAGDPPLRVWAMKGSFFILGRRYLSQAWTQVLCVSPGKRPVLLDTISIIAVYSAYLNIKIIFHSSYSGRKTSKSVHSQSYRNLLDSFSSSSKREPARFCTYTTPRLSISKLCRWERKNFV